jgi:hypothetical protein
MANNERIPNLEIANARLIFRNLSGKPDKFNAKGGIRKFGVIIDPSIAEDLRNEGWNIKMLPPKEIDGEPLYYLSVKVQYGEYRQPNVYLITNGRKQLLDEDAVASIDYAELLDVNLVIQPHYWEVNGKSGINAYLKTGYFEIQTDSFASKYEDIPF